MVKKVLPIIFIIAITITGCDGSQRSPIPPPPVNSSQKTTTPSITPSMAVSTTTSMPSPTAPPTLSPEQAQATILEWLETNGNCRLPCIWNLEPGITTTQTRRDLLASFEKAEKENFRVSRTPEDENPGSIGYSYQSDETHYLSISLLYFEEDGYISYLTLLTNVSNNDIRVFDDADYKRLTHYYSLGQILINYGPPSDIYLATWPHDPFAKRDYEPFIIVLIYTELGFRVEYVFKAEKLEDQIIGCPADSVLTITTWRPKADISLQEIATIGIGYEFNKVSYKFFKPIDEVTSINIDDFYQSYAVEDATECITTPSEIWYSGIP